MSTVRTLSGDVPATSLGLVNSHDHLFLSSPALAGAELDDAKAAQESVALARGFGIAAISQWTPAGMVRRLDQLRTISSTSSVAVIAATGRHRRVHYLDNEATVSVDDLSERFVKDVNERRCGFIKVGVDMRALDAFERNSVQAAAIAAIETGAPIAVHLEDGTGGRAIVEQLGILGVSPQQVVLGHVTRNGDTACLLDTAKSGAYLCLDVPRDHKGAETLWRGFDELVNAGASRQILFGTDTTTREARKGTSQALASLMEFVGLLGAEVMKTNSARAWSLL